MTIRVYTHSPEQEKDLLDFLESKHYSYNSDDDEMPDAAFLDEYNKELDESKAQIDRGEYFTQEEVKKFFEEKRKRILERNN